MTKEEAIKYLQQLYPNGGHCWLDEQRIEAIGMAVKALQEYPVSEELEEAAKRYGTEGDEISGLSIIDEEVEAFKAGANWQKEQFEKNRIAACDRQTEEEAEREQDFVMGIIENEHRQPTFDDAIKYGMRLQRENMMKDATDVTVHIEAGNYPYIPQLELYDYDKDVPLAKKGDKYKVVLIKED